MYDIDVSMDPLYDIRGYESLFMLQFTHTSVVITDRRKEDFSVFVLKVCLPNYHFRGVHGCMIN